MSEPFAVYPSKQKQCRMFRDRITLEGKKIEYFCKKSPGSGSPTKKTYQWLKWPGWRRKKDILIQGIIFQSIIHPRVSNVVCSHFFFHGKRMNRIWSGTQMMFNQNWYLWTVCKPKRTLNAWRSGKIPSWQVHDAFCLSFSFGFVQNPIISQQPM